MPSVLLSLHSTVSGQDKYYMTFTREEQQDGKVVKIPETYDLEEYFDKFVIQKQNENNTDTNTVKEETNVVETNVILTNEQNVGNTNTVATNVA